jgi:hypothetical protein
MSLSWDSGVVTVVSTLALAVMSGQGFVLNGMSALFVAAAAIVGVFVVWRRKR